MSMMPSYPPAVSKIPLILPNICPCPCPPQAPLGHPLPSPSCHYIPRNCSEALQNAILAELLRLPELILGKWVFQYEADLINTSVLDLFKLEGDKVTMQVYLG